MTAPSCLLMRWAENRAKKAVKEDSLFKMEIETACVNIKKSRKLSLKVFFFSSESQLSSSYLMIIRSYLSKNVGRTLINHCYKIMKKLIPSTNHECDHPNINLTNYCLYVHTYNIEVKVFMKSNYDYYLYHALLQCIVPKGDLHCQCILSIFPASVHQFYANLLAFVNINPFLYINNQFALDDHDLIHFWMKDIQHCRRDCADVLPIFVRFC